MKNSTTTSKFPLPTDKGWTRLPERVLEIREDLDTLMAVESPKDLLAETLDLSDVLNFNPVFRELGKVTKLINIPASQDFGSITPSWRASGQWSNSSFYIQQLTPITYRISLTLSYSEITEFNQTYADDFTNYQGVVNFEGVDADNSSNIHNISMNVTSTEYQDNFATASYVFTGTLVSISSGFPLSAQFYFSPGYSMYNVNSFEFITTIPEKFGAILDSEISLPDVTSDLILGSTSEEAKTIEYANYINSNFNISNQNGQVKKATFTLYSVSQKSRTALAAELLKAVTKGSFDMYFYDSYTSSYVTVSVVNAKSFYTDFSNSQIEFIFDSQDSTTYYFDSYSVPTGTVGYSIPYTQPLDLSLIDSVINGNTLIFPKDWGLNVGDIIQVRNSINSIGFKDTEGAIQKVISYNNKTGKITYDGVKESVIISSTDSVFSANAGFANEPNNNNSPWKTSESVNIGKNANTYGGGYAVSIGSQSSAATYAVAVGNEAKANNMFSVSLGYNTRSDNNSSVAVGLNSASNGAVSVGANTIATSYGGGVIGNNTKVYASGGAGQGVGFTLGTVRYGNTGPGGASKTFISYTSGSNNRQSVLNSGEIGKWYWNTDNYYNPTQNASQTYNTDIFGLLGNEARNSVLIIKGTLAMFGLTGWTSNGDGIPSTTNYKIVDIYYVIGKSNTSRNTSQWQIINQQITTVMTSGNGSTWDMGLELTNSRVINPFSLITTATTDAQYALRGEISIDTLKF
jgi:hypothetical protein